MRRALRLAARIGFYALIGLIAFYAAFPFYWAVVSSLKTGSALFEPELSPDLLATQAAREWLDLAPTNQKVLRFLGYI